MLPFCIGRTWFKLPVTSSTGSYLLLHMTNEQHNMALPHHFCFGLQQERLCKTDLSGLKLSVNVIE